MYDNTRCKCDNPIYMFDNPKCMWDNHIYMFNNQACMWNNLIYMLDNAIYMFNNPTCMWDNHPYMFDKCYMYYIYQYATIYIYVCIFSADGQPYAIASHDLLTVLIIYFPFFFLPHQQHPTYLGLEPRDDSASSQLSFELKRLHIVSSSCVNFGIPPQNPTAIYHTRSSDTESNSHSKHAFTLVVFPTLFSQTKTENKMLETLSEPQSKPQQPKMRPYNIYLNGGNDHMAVWRNGIASDYDLSSQSESGDCRFDPCLGHIFVFDSYLSASNWLGALVVL